MNSKKTITFLTLPHPIENEHLILDENSFRTLYLDTDLTQQQVATENNLSIKMVQASVKYYKQVLPSEVQEKVSKGYRLAAYRRLPGIHQRPEIKVNKSQLISLLAEGKTEWDIAKVMGVAPQTIRKNIRRYGLLVPSQKISNISDTEWLHIEWANQLAPGLLEGAYRGVDNPTEFFHKLYDAFVELCKILWTIQKLGGRYSHYQEHKKVERDYVSWRINKQEILLSEELRKLDIFHIRGYYWAKSIGKGFNADIFIPEANLLVEINGNIHSIGFVIDHDEEKTKLVAQLGYKRLMFLSGEVDKELDSVVEKIKKEMENGKSI